MASDTTQRAEKMAHDELARKIKRYSEDRGIGMEQDPHGPFVLYAEHVKAIAAALKARDVPEGFIRTSQGDMHVICITHAGRASAPGKPYDGEPMQDIRVAWPRPAAESARDGGTKA